MARSESNLSTEASSKGVLKKFSAIKFSNDVVASKTRNIIRQKKEAFFIPQGLDNIKRKTSPQSQKSGFDNEKR